MSGVVAHKLSGFRVPKYAWIKQHVIEFSVKTMCQFMSVSRSAYYA